MGSSFNRFLMGRTRYKRNMYSEHYRKDNIGIVASDRSDGEFSFPRVHRKQRQPMREAVPSAPERKGRENYEAVRTGSCDHTRAPIRSPLGFVNDAESSVRLFPPNCHSFHQSRMGRHFAFALPTSLLVPHPARVGVVSALQGRGYTADSAEPCLLPPRRLQRRSMHSMLVNLTPRTHTPV